MTKYLKTMVVLFIFLLLFVLYGCDSSKISLALDNSKVEEAISNEFNSIQAISNATESDYYFTKKTELMAIGAGYTTNHSYNEIIDYYDAKLKENGWQFYKEEKLTGWGRDLGGSAVRYKKGDFVATVQYAGEKAKYGWTYAFSMSWGLRYE